MSMRILNQMTKVVLTACLVLSVSFWGMGCAESGAAKKSPDKKTRGIEKRGHDHAEEDGKDTKDGADDTEAGSSTGGGTETPEG